jgi:serine/threonine-protein kinase PRP4
MFGSPSSEEKANKQKKRKKPKATKQNNGEKKTAARQDGFDDTDGYYKASIGETMELEVLGIGDGDDGGDEARTLRLRVLGVIGKGVFSSVLKCSTTTNAAGAPLSTHGDGIPTTISLGGSSEQQQHGLPSEVAIKCIRSNETMAKAALDEMKFLIRLRDSPGIVPLLYPSGPTPASNGNNSNGSTAANPNYVPPPIDFRGHTVLVFPYLPYNLRDVLQKFGKGVGLSLGAVKNYYGQLLSAAKHLQTKRVIHADIKPDNILVSTDFSRVVLADFGSALESTVDESSEEGGRPEGGGGGSATHEAVTPYLVSRFYRAPEIILGLQPLTHAIDLWSLAVTAGELFLGKVLLKGASNNDMLHAMIAFVSRVGIQRQWTFFRILVSHFSPCLFFIVATRKQTQGPFSGRLIKSHLLQTKKHPLQAHFSQVQSTYVFRQETVDPVLGRAVHKEVSLAGGAFSATLQSKLLRAKSPKDTRTEILLFADLLTKCLLLDPSKRVSVRAALKHGFFVRQQPQQQQQQQHH